MKLRTALSILLAIALMAMTPGFSPAAADAASADSSADSIADQSIAALKNYRSQLLGRVLHRWSRPDPDAVCVLSFDIASDGSPGRVTVVQSSGKTATDNAALEAIQNAAPFRPLPNGLDRISTHFKFSSSPSLYTETAESARLFRQAAASIESADFPVAIEKLERALDIAGGDCDRYSQLLSQAFVSYSLFLPSNSPAVPAQLYQSLRFNPNNDGARQQLNELLASKGINPKDSKIRLALAKKAMHERNMELAEVELLEAKRLIDGDDATASDISEIEALVYLYNDCSYWQKFLQKHPDSFDGHLGLGLAWQRGNKLDSATAEFKKALAIDPRSSYAKLLLQSISDHLPPE